MNYVGPNNNSSYDRYSQFQQMQNHNNETSENVLKDNLEMFGEDSLQIGEKMKDPVVVQCGHTFDRSSIDYVKKGAREKNEPMRCPEDRKIIDENLMIPNLFAKDAIETVNSLTGYLQRIEGKFDELKIQNQDLAKQITLSNAQMELSNKQMELSNQRTQNVINMSCASKLFALFDPCCCRNEAEEVSYEGTDKLSREIVSLRNKVDLLKTQQNGNII